MKKLVFILFLSLKCIVVFAQTDTNVVPSTDTSPAIKKTVLPKPVKKRVRVDTIQKRAFQDTLGTRDSATRKDTFLSLVPNPTTNEVIDSVKPIAAAVKIKKPIDSFYLKLLDNPFLRTDLQPIYLVINERKRTSKDEIFYLILALLAFLAFIKLAFSKYFQNIFKLFFQPSFRQKQTREQLQQGILPSLLLNLFFVFSAAAYVSFLLSYYRVVNASFWLLLLYSALTLGALYTGKYIFLSFAGWVFNVKEATDAYIFAIYLINKILGVVLVPFILIIAFSPLRIQNISITISILLIILLFFYRYVVAFGPVQREVKVSPLHFFFYVLAFEITPLLLIYKTLMLYLDKSL